MDEDTILDMKELNGKNYQAKFKNRGKIGFASYPKLHLGNSMSMARSRPSAHTGCSTRIANKKTNTGDADNLIVDTAVDKEIFPRKSVLEKAVPYGGHIKTNTQIPSKSVSKKKKQEPMYVHLNEIKFNLYLGNEKSIEDLEFISRMRCIINLSGSKLSVHKYATVHDIQMRDCRTMKTKEFLDVFQKVERIISTYGYLNTLIICQKGVNRSVSMVIMYAMKHKGMKYVDVLTYIQEKKDKKYKYWECVNNIKFTHILQEQEKVFRS